MKHLSILAGCAVMMAGCVRTNIIETHRAPGQKQAAKMIGWVALDSTEYYEVRNAGPAVNTSEVEYAPSSRPAGEALYYVSDRTGGAGLHDVWIARKSSPDDSLFSVARPMGETMNTTRNEGALAFAPDGKTVYFTACHRKDSVGDCDIYTGTLDGDEIRNIRNLREINSLNWDSQPAISPDGGWLYFASTRNQPAIKEWQSDIYACRKQDDGSWGMPVALGSNVNTKRRDESPCVALDGRALFFVSNGYRGYGGYDLYVSYRREDGTWGGAENLGNLFNTAADERSVMVTPDGSMIYFSSARTDLLNFGSLDIYQARRIPTPEPR